MMTMSLPIGLKFRPSDEELVEYFLPLKLKGESFLPILDRTMFGDKLPWQVLKDDDPWEYKMEGSKTLEKIAYVFTKLAVMSKSKYGRTAGGGTWEGKSLNQDLKNSRGQVIGRRRQFRFRPKKDQTRGNNKERWIMHQYTSLLVKSDYVLCRIVVDGIEESKDSLPSDVGCGTSTSLDCDDTRKRKSSSIVLDSEVDGGNEKRARIVEQENLEVFEIEEGDVHNVQQISEEDFGYNVQAPRWSCNDEGDGVLEDIVLPSLGQSESQQAIISCDVPYDEDIMANTYPSFADLLDEVYYIQGVPEQPQQQQQQFSDAYHDLDEEGTQLLPSTPTMDDASLVKLLNDYLSS